MKETTASWRLQHPALKGAGKGSEEMQVRAVEVEEQGRAGRRAQAPPGLHPAGTQSRRPQEALSSPGGLIYQEELEVRAEEESGADKLDRLKTFGFSIISLASKSASSSHAGTCQPCSLPRAEPAAPPGSETTAKPLLLAQAPRTRSRCWCFPFILTQFPFCSSSFPSLRGWSLGSSPVVHWGDMGPDSRHMSVGGWTPQMPLFCTVPPNKAASNPKGPKSPAGLIPAPAALSQMVPG